MSVVLVILGFVGMIAALVSRALLIEEFKGRIRLRIEASLEATISSLPNELQAEHSEEWRADLSAVIAMPLTAAQFVRGVRVSARELVAEPALAPVGIGGRASAHTTFQLGAVVSTQRARRNSRRRMTRVVAVLRNMSSVQRFSLAVAVIAILGLAGVLVVAVVVVVAATVAIAEGAGGILAAVRHRRSYDL